MSSNLRRYPQLSVQTQYLIAIGDVSGYQYAGSASGGVEYDVTSFDSPVNRAAGTLMKDMGRVITVYDDTVSLPGTQPTYPKTAVYRQVQLVNGAATSGVGGGPDNWNTFWVKVWSADGVSALVARTG